MLQDMQMSAAITKNPTLLPNLCKYYSYRCGVYICLRIDVHYNTMYVSIPYILVIKKTSLSPQTSFKNINWTPFAMHRSAIFQSPFNAVDIL